MAYQPPEIVDDLPRLADRDPTTHKGQVGQVAIFAGSEGMSGAAVLCGLGALRGGAGLVEVHTPRAVHAIVAASEPCLMVHPLDPPRDSGPTLGRLGIPDGRWAQWDVVALGPGVGRSDAAAALLRACCANAKELVLDADGLNLAAAQETQPAQSGASWRLRGGRPTVLTPHPGEMARLRAAAGMDAALALRLDDESRVRCAHEYAGYSGAIVVLKGHHTVVASATRAYINTTGNPGMATGGMGDVLTGLIAALLGQAAHLASSRGDPPADPAFDAARLGVYVHGLAGDRCAERIGPVGFLARELAEAIPAALLQSRHRHMGFRA